MRQGLEPLGPDRGQHDSLHPEIRAAGCTGLSGAAIDEHPVAARREPLTDLFHARLEAAIGCRHTAGAQHNQAHLARKDGGPHPALPPRSGSEWFSWLLLMYYSW